MKAPKNIEDAARARVQAASTQVQISLDAIQKRRPLDAEQDEERKVRRIARVTGASPEQARDIAAYKTPTSLALPEPAARRAEAIQGLTTDFVPVVFLEQARTAANAVGRVVTGNLRGLGSAFLISDKLLLTNNHVIPDVATASQFLVEFFFEIDAAQRPRAVTRYRLNPDMGNGGFFLTRHENDLDFTVVAIGDRRDGGADLVTLGMCPLLARDDKHVLGEFVNVIQHPDADYKQVVLRENRLVNRDPRVLHYVADTNPGSSGSPVFNDQWEVIALHHWGEPHLVQTTTAGEPLGRDMNEGIRISAIVEELERDLPHLPAGPRSILGNALALREQVVPPLPVVVQPATHQPASGRTNSTADRTVIANVDRVASSGDAMTWTIPLEVTVRMGVPRAGTANGADALSRLPAGATSIGEKLVIDTKYSNRRGYNPSFLATKVPLPKLNPQQKAQAARKTKVKQGEDPFELKYQHFSIVMNRERRMAFFTAVNIDGNTWVHIVRETGLPKESAEATEVWFEDPRIVDDHQTHQDLYDKQKPKRLFDRGHLVRRQDPAWGSDAKAIKANADTHHFTNCAPQASTFNQRVQFWQGLEQWILEDNAVADEERVTVFTGPVFDDDDKDYRYVKVPKQFWKVVVFMSNGKPRATAVLADQSKWLKSLPESIQADGSESLSELPEELEEYQSTVAEIEDLTGLDFGKVRDWDTNGGGESLEAGPESLASRRRRLRSFDDLVI